MSDGFERGISHREVRDAKRAGVLPWLNNMSKTQCFLLLNQRYVLQEP